MQQAQYQCFLIAVRWNINQQKYSLVHRRHTKLDMCFLISIPYSYCQAVWWNRYFPSFLIFIIIGCFFSITFVVYRRHHGYWDGQLNVCNCWVSKCTCLLYIYFYWKFIIILEECFSFYVPDEKKKQKNKLEKPHKHYRKIINVKV